MATPQWYQWWKFRKPADYIPPAIGEARIGQPSRLEEATPWAQSIADILGTAGRAVGDYLGGFEERRQRTIEAAPEALRPFLKEPLPERLLEALRTTPENVAGILSALAQTGQMRAREGPDWAEAVEQGRQWFRQAGEPQVLPDIYPVVPPGEVPEAYPVPGTEPILEKPVLPWKGFLETLPETFLYGGPVMGPARAAAAKAATQATRAGARRLLAEEAGMVRVPRGKPFFEGMKPIDVWDGLGRAEKMRAAKAAKLDPKIATRLWKDIAPEERAALEGLVPERVAPPEVPLPEAEAAPRAAEVIPTISREELLAEARKYGSTDEFIWEVQRALGVYDVQGQRLPMGQGVKTPRGAALYSALGRESPGGGWFDSADRIWREANPGQTPISYEEAARRFAAPEALAREPWQMTYEEWRAALPPLPAAKPEGMSDIAWEMAQVNWNMMRGKPEYGARIRQAIDQGKPVPREAAESAGLLGEWEAKVGAAEAPRAGLVEEAGRIPEGEVVPPPPPSAKEPWQMTFAELQEWRRDLGTRRQIEVNVEAIRTLYPDVITAEDAYMTWVANRLETAIIPSTRHKIAIRQALSEGKPVPPEVLADYPDLAQIAPREAERAAVPPEAPRLVPKLTEPPFAEALLPEQEVIPRPEVSDEVLREELGRRWRQQNEEFWRRERARQEVPGEAPPPPPTEPPIAAPPGGEVPERGFITHTAESPMGSPVLRKLYDEDPVVYSPITNRATLEDAVRNVDADPIMARARVMADIPLEPDTLVDTMAQGIVLMRRAANEGDVKELYTLSRRIAERLTPSAQAVQLASTIDKLTPEGLFVYINRIIKKSVTEGKGPAVARRIEAAAQRETVKRETEATRGASAKAEEALTQARQRAKDVAETTTKEIVGGVRTTRGNQRARDLQYLIDDSIREVQATLTPADRQAIIKAKAILKQSATEMTKDVANDFLDRAAMLRGLTGEARVKGIMELVEEVRNLPAVRAGAITGRLLKPSPRLLKQQAADLEQLIDRASRNVYQQLNSADRLAVARVKAILRRTDVELPQGMAEEFLIDARNIRGLPIADQASALNKLTTKIKEFDPVAKELARKRAIADAEARLRQSARQAAKDLEAFIDAQSRKAATAGATLADRKAIGQAKGILTKHGAEMPEDMARDWLERAKALNALPEAEQPDAIRALVNEIKDFDPVREAREAQALIRQRTAAARQYAKDQEYLAHQEARETKVRLKNVEREVIRSAKSRFRSAGVEMPEELAQSFLDRAHALRSITDEFDQMRAAQALLRDVHNLLPPSKWDTFLNIIGLPRAIKAAYDLSFSLRQGVIHAWGQPRAWWESVKTNVRSFASEAEAEAADRAFFARPLYKPLQEAGLEYIDRFGPLSQQEETFMTSWAGKIPGARQSERAYITTGNKLRSGTADSVVMGWMTPEISTAVEDRRLVLNTLEELIQVTGKTRQDFTRLAQWENVKTGRGDFGNFLISNNQWLNALFFAPRFAVSRLQVPYLGVRNMIQNPVLRSTVGRDLGGFIAGSTAMLLAVDQIPGVEVEWDPRSTDFGKFRYGSLAIDFLGGYAPLMRYIAQLMTGERKARGGAIVEVDRLEVLLRNILGTKLSPIASEGVDLLRGKDALGNTIETWEERLGRLAKDYVPFLAQDIWEAWQEMGLVGVGIAAPISLFGGSVGAYTTITDKFDRLARQATGDKITRWQDLPAAQRLELESSPEVLALLDPGEKTIPMNLRRYLEPRDYENWQKIVDATGEEFLALPEIERLGAKAPLTGSTIDNKRLTLEQRAEYQHLFWEKAKPGLERLFGSPTYKAAKDDYKRKLISRILGTARDSVHSKVLKMRG